MRWAVRSGGRAGLSRRAGAAREGKEAAGRFIAIAMAIARFASQTLISLTPLGLLYARRRHSPALARPCPPLPASLSCPHSVPPGLALLAPACVRRWHRSRHLLLHTRSPERPCVCVLTTALLGAQSRSRIPGGQFSKLHHEKRRSSFLQPATSLPITARRRALTSRGSAAAAPALFGFGPAGSPAVLALCLGHSGGNEPARQFSIATTVGQDERGVEAGCAPVLPRLS